MGEHERRSPTHCGFKRCLDQTLALGIERTGRLVEQEQGRVLEHCPSDRDTLTLPAPAAVSSGDGVKVGTLFGVATTDAASGALVALVTQGVFTLPKATGQTHAVGAAIYWTGTACTTATTTGNLFIGHAVLARASGDTTTNVRLAGGTAAVTA